MADSEKKCGMTCPLTGCPIKKVLITTIVAFVVSMAFDWVFHGIYMKDAYLATASMWRSDEEMKGMMNFCLIYHGVLAFGVAALYCMFSKSSDCKGSCPKRGIKFGFLVGLILGISHFASYIWMPIPLEMALNWLAGSVAWGVILGFVLSLLSRCCNKSCQKDAA